MQLFTVILVLVLLAISLSLRAEVPTAPIGERGVHVVTRYGAKGDGKTDDTLAFQKALDAAAADGGGIVFVPRGDFLIKGHLNVPPRVTLEGLFRAPSASDWLHGSTLLAVEGRGKEDGEPFIRLNSNSTLKGVIIFYPEQDKENPVPYPWCIAGKDDNCSIIDVQLVNPWKAVDFGTVPCGRHYIRGLYAQPIHTGIFIDQCYDVGRLEDIHLWPFWDIPLMKNHTRKNGTAFLIGRTDWEYMSNCFCIFFKVGFHFKDFVFGKGPKSSGQPNVVIVNSGSDLGPCAVLVEKSQGHAGISFTNGQFMAGVEVKETNAGPVKFTNCGFWGIPNETGSHAVIEGRGHVTFNSCHFITWDTKGENQPAIFSNGRSLTVMGCDFMDAGRSQIVLGENQETAIIFGNQMRGGIKIDNKSKGKVEIGLNAEN